MCMPGAEAATEGPASVSTQIPEPSHYFSVNKFGAGIRKPGEPLTLIVRSSSDRPRHSSPCSTHQLHDCALEVAPPKM